MVSCPALFVAAPASGHGKTTVVAALARLNTRLGRRVRVFKCGPDFLDPMIHAHASGHPCENIDLMMCGEDDARFRLARAAAEADLVLVEGVMGLYDSEPTGAELARRLGLPILLVIDAAAMGASFGAIAWGLKTYRDGAPITHALANRVAGEFHAGLCRESLPEGILWAGSLPRAAEAALPERHLGLLPAAEIAHLDARLERLADLLAHTPLATLPPAVDFRAVPPAPTFRGESAPGGTSPFPPAPTFTRPLEGRVIAVARDAAFCFLYPANLECLEALGARLAFFSPLHDAALPECDAVWLPGGYPELHAETIAANAAMRQALQAHVAAGKPLLAECGGLMACCETLHDLTGRAHRMWGLLPGVTRMQKELAGLGLLAAELPEGRLTGHSFHFSTFESPLAPVAQAVSLAGRGGEAIWRRGRLTASYMHCYFPSNPRAAASLFLS
ncbi:MAG: cobyrinate a,c-diamide synthase [Rhodocyclaceae bacterium]|nr:cobyrinate a,c-diamide synthase [Rhodocyclaceae bacterium]